MKRPIHHHDARTGVALCGDRHGNNRYSTSTREATCGDCIEIVDARARGAACKEAHVSLSESYRHLWSAVMHAANAHVELLAVRAGRTEINTAEATFRELRHAMSEQVRLADALGLRWSEPPTLRVVPDLEDQEQEVSR